MGVALLGLECDLRARSTLRCAGGVGATDGTLPLRQARCSEKDLSP